MRLPCKMLSVQHHWILSWRSCLLSLVYQVQVVTCKQSIRPCFDRWSSPVHVKRRHADPRVEARLPWQAALCERTQEQRERRLNACLLYLPHLMLQASPMYIRMRNMQVRCAGTEGDAVFASRAAVAIAAQIWRVVDEHVCSRSSTSIGRRPTAEEE